MRDCPVECDRLIGGWKKKDMPMNWATSDDFGMSRIANSTFITLLVSATCG